MGKPRGGKSDSVAGAASSSIAGGAANAPKRQGGNPIGNDRARRQRLSDVSATEPGEV